MSGLPMYTEYRVGRLCLADEASRCIEKDSFMSTMLTRRCLEMLFFLFLATSVGPITTFAEDYRTYVIRPPINNDPILPGEPLPIQCRDERVMKVLCARGEYEPASFLIETDQLLQQVLVSVSSLTGLAGQIPSEVVDVRIAQKFYSSITYGKEIMPWVLVHDPGMIRIIDHLPKYYRELEVETVGPSENPISLAEYQAGNSKINELVKELIDTETLQPGDIEDFRQFWLTVRVPEDAGSGIYHGTVTITAENGATTNLTLEVTVPSFDLLPPRFEYGAYYPTELDREELSDGQRDRYNPITAEQYLAECRNMVAHGCTNPCIYAGPQLDQDGNIHFTHLSRLLDLREKAGMPKGVPLYMFDGGGVIMREGTLTEEEKRSSANATRTVVKWVRDRGYLDAFFMGGDEFSGERLRAERDSFQAIHDGGGKVWVANQGDFVDIVGDLLDRPVLSHPGAHIVDNHQQWHVNSRDFLMNRQRLVKWDPALWLMPHYQRSIRGAHQFGNKIFSYFDPQGGQQVPEQHRRHRGLGMWKAGLDGTMTWAYIHIYTPTPRLGDPDIKDKGIAPDQNSFVIRGPQGVLDKLSWEGYREGYDDARYLATLEDALTKAEADGRHAKLVGRTRRWLDNLTVHADLDQWRREMVRRIELLLSEKEA